MYARRGKANQKGMILIKIGGEISGDCSRSKDKVEGAVDWFSSGR